MLSDSLHVLSTKPIIYFVRFRKNNEVIQFGSDQFCFLGKADFPKQYFADSMLCILSYLVVAGV